MKYISKKEINKICSKHKIISKIIYQFLTIIVENNNKKYLSQKIKECKDLFKDINGCTLDNEQMEAILKEEDSTLVIAGAGSGKTITMIGKIKYLIEKQNISPSRILCLSFTNAITKDFEETVEKTLGVKMDVYTFHKLGMKVLNLNHIPINLCEENKLKESISKIVKKEEENLHKIFSKTVPKKEIENIIETFIHLYKANNQTPSIASIKEKIKNEKNSFMKKRNQILIEIIEETLKEYQAYLEEENKIDFNDMINQAATLIEEGYTYPEYDYIIVDEYQDTSYTRYRLLNAIKEKNNCPLLAVGDDWQSIYRFTGCNIEMFTNFNHYFKNSSISKIQTTYRNPQELITVAGNFIMKNKNQYKKQLKSNKHLEKPIKIFLTEEEFDIELLLEDIPYQNILLLSRNNKDFNFLKQKYSFSNNVFEYKNKKITCMTVHKSKGLQSEAVILINLKDDILGFPSKLTDDPILKYLQTATHFPYEEERRLFYVALTRTKNEIYLLSPRENKSIFVEEIIKNDKQNIEMIQKKYYCEHCHTKYSKKESCPFCKRKKI
jgi:DNA helicase-4